MFEPAIGLTKTSSKGQRIVITILEHADEPYLSARVDGKRVGNGDSTIRPATVPGHPLITHAVGVIALTTNEAEALQAALDAARAQIETPEVLARRALQTLRSDREWLCHQIAGAHDERDASYWRGHQHDGSYAQACAQPHEPKIAAAYEALQAFDAAHPEVIAGLQEERDERARRAVERGD